MTLNHRRAAGAHILLVATLPLAAFAGQNSWTGSGPEGGNIRDLEYHPAETDTVFAMTRRGLYRSGSGGSDWTLINDDVTDAVFAIDPTDSDVMYLAGPDEDLLKSSDGGETAAPLAGWPGGSVTGIDVGSEGIVYVSTTDQGVLRSADGGASWEGRSAGLPQNGLALIDAVFVDPDDPNVVYATLGSFSLGVYKTIDGGADWDPANTGLTSLTVSDLAIDPRDPATLYAATDSGVMYSLNAADSWNAATEPIDFNGNLRASTVAVDPTTGSTVVYAGTPGGGFFKSPDAGDTWDLANTGFGTSTTRAIAVSPADGEQLIAGTVAGLKRSTNAADNWVTANDGVIASNVTALASDPLTSGTLYASANGIFKTTTGASSWTSVTDAGAVDILVDPTDPQILYLASNGIQRSPDGGQSYETVLANVDVEILAYSASDGGIYALDAKEATIYRSADGLSFPVIVPVDVESALLALIVDSADGDTLYVGTQDGASRSTDGGESWTDVADLSGMRVTSLAQDPTDAAAFYAATDEGVFRSDDSGATWTAGAADVVERIVVDPDAPEILYGTGTGVLRSLDGGASWHAIPANDPEDWTSTRLALDGDTNRVAYRVFAGTTTQGVERVDLAHDLQATVTGPSSDVGIEVDFDYTTVVTNAGPGDAPRVTLSQTLPTNKSTFVSATPDQGSCEVSGSELTCDLGVVADGADATVLVTMHSTDQGALRSTATVTSFDQELDQSDNSATATASITQLYDLVATISGPASATVGNEVTYTATVSNDGPNTASGTSFVTSIPGGTTFVSAETDANCTRDEGTLSCNLGAMDAGESADIEVVFTADQSGALTSTITVSASGGTDSDPSNDEATLTTQASSGSSGGGGGDGGGGGALDAWTLLAMLMLGFVRRRGIASCR